MIELYSEKIFIENFDKQLNFINKELSSVINTNFSILNYLNLPLIIENHIKANFSNTKNELVNSNKFSLNNTQLLLGSMTELRSRIIAQQNYNLKTLSLVHGDGFGILDEPLFGKIILKYYADKIIGYGDFYLNYQNDYSYTINSKVYYLPTNSSIIYKNYSQKHYGPLRKDIVFCYCPTSLSGYRARYGPFRDTSDYEYVQWHKILVKHFKNNISFKLHPKNKFGEYKKYDCKYIDGDLINNFNKIDVFIFDYVSTALFYACASNKPIIFFDIGLRNINKKILNKLKERVIYINLLEDNIPSLKEIFTLILYKKKNNDFPKYFSLTNNNYNRIKAINKILLNNDQ